MEKEYIYKHIRELNTPAGVVAVYDGDKKMPFSVVRNCMDIPYKIYGDGGEMIGTIHTETNYQIIIKSKELQIGKEYIIKFSCGKWEYCDSDEHTTCYCTTVDDWVIGIGAYDPCDYWKDEQMWKYSKQQGFLERGFCQAPPIYDESHFEKYTVEELDDLSGYKFKLFDYKSDSIRFEVAWLQVKDYPIIECESALGLWLC